MKQPKQPSLRSRNELSDIMEDSVSVVDIPGTKKKIRLRWIKPYTLERLTKVWLERENAIERMNTGAEVLKNMALEPYFAFKEAALMILNNDIRIRLFYGLYWRYLAHKYSEAQILPIVEEGKKKLPLMAHYGIMVFTTDMRTDMMNLTKAEAERYQAELLSVAKHPLLKTFRLTDIPDGAFSAGSETLDTDASSHAPR